MMEAAAKRTGRRCRKLAPCAVALVLAAIIGGASTAPAGAQEWNNNNRGRETQRAHNDRHDNRRDNRFDNRDRGRNEYPTYERPAYAYAPPPVYYAPPPGPPVVDLVFPFRFN
jgi:hypothetical protein